MVARLLEACQVQGSVWRSMLEKHCVDCAALSDDRFYGRQKDVNLFSVMGWLAAGDSCYAVTLGLRMVTLARSRQASDLISR